MTSVKGGQNSTENQTFLSGIQCLQNAISQWPICVKFGHSMCINVIINPFGKELPNFDHLRTKKTNF